MQSVVERSFPLDLLKGVGPKTRQYLVGLHIHSIEELLFHLPLRYEDRTRITPIKELKPGDRVLVEGAIKSGAIIGRRRKSLVCRLEDDDGASIGLRFFHFNASQRARLTKKELRLRCFGEVRAGFNGGLELIHPEYKEMQALDELPLAERLTAVYATTQGLQQNTWRKLMHQALQYLRTEIVLPELLPAELLLAHQLPSLREALLFIHEPPVGVDLSLLLAHKHPAQRRLSLEELLAHHVSLKKARAELQNQQAVSCDKSSTLEQNFLASLPFQLTDAQQRVLDEIRNDLAKSYPMLRLVQGDVGCGKTVVAALSALRMIASGYQVAIMAPTELLAEQHWRNFQNWFAPLNVGVVYLVGSLSAKQREPVLSAMHAGQAQLIVGTHALFQEGVHYHNLALVIIDEQHRFGVHQRLALREKANACGLCPHQLVMTATPIPRTLAMTAYADLDCSIIDALPPGRKPVGTILVPQIKRVEVMQRVAANCREGRQVYWVCTLIEESEVLECKAAQDVAVELQQQLTGLQIAVVHGRLKAEEKEAIMQQFKAGKVDVLVATTVIEVGVDVPNASLMIIDNPERLGLAQLHQLRGRVGRGSVQSYCVLLYKAPLSEYAKQRLQIMRDCVDGFQIAEQDLLLRGPGEVLGTQQAGALQFRVADLIRDDALLELVKNLALQLSPQMIDALIKRWLAHALDYRHV